MKTVDSLRTRTVYEAEAPTFRLWVLSHPPEPKRQCLIWSENHEHAVASVDDDIHPQAKRVWLEFEDFDVIYAYEKHWKTGDWELVERKKGNIPLVNNDPFKPDSESIFPVNK